MTSALVVGAPRAFRRQQVALLVLTWRFLDVSLAIDQGQLGSCVGWVGMTVSVHKAGGGGVLTIIANLAWT